MHLPKWFGQMESHLTRWVRALVFSISIYSSWYHDMLHTIDAVGLFRMLMQLTLLSLFLGLLLQIFCLLVPEPLLFLDGVQDVGAFYKLRVIWPNPLVSQLFVFLFKILA